jgi:hypothetical protein
MRIAINNGRTKLIIAATIAVLTLVARFAVISPATASFLIIKCGYWAVAITFAGFAGLLIRHLSGLGGMIKQWRVHRAGLLCVLAAGIYLQSNEPRKFKVLFDEFVISGVARNMHFDREATFPWRAHYFNGRLIIMGNGVDKRPFFFPFIISLVHDLTGYRPENVFYINAGLAVILLLLVYAMGFTLGGTRLGCLGVLLLAGLPLIAQNATDGGYELANLVMILTLYFLGSFYYRSPGARGLDLFILTAVLLAQVRYESILYVLVVVAVVMCKWYHEKQITLTWMAVLSPVMLLMPLLSNEVLSTTAGFLQTKADQSFLSLHYLSDNAIRAIFFLYNPSFDSTNSVLLSVVGTLGAAFFLLLVAQKAKQWFSERKDELVLAFVFGVTGVNTFLVLCVFWGHWDDPMVSRFSLPLQLLMVVVLLRVSMEFLKSRPMPRWPLLVAGVWIVLFAAPASARKYATDGIVTSREYSWLAEYLAHKDPSTVLTITGSSLGPILENMPAISIETAKQYRWQVKACLGSEFYKEIVILQRFEMNLKTGKYEETGPSRLGPGFKLETIAERYFRPNMVSRLSRVVDVDLTNVRAPDGLGKDRTQFTDEEDLVTYLLKKLP